MKLNENFANVYTPYHDLDYIYHKKEEIIANEKISLVGLNVSTN
jgi:hypothetical protein